MRDQILINKISLILTRADRKLVINILIHHVLLIDLDHVRLGRHVLLDHALNTILKSRGKQPGALSVFGLLKDLLQLLLKAHAQHLVRLVQYQMTDRLQTNRLELEQIHEAAWRGHHNVRGTLQFFNL